MKASQPCQHAPTVFEGAHGPSKRRWWFRVVAMLIIPALLFATTEIILRFAGYGWSTSLFIRENTAQGAVWTDNPRFTQLYFPAGMARNPEHFSFPVLKPPNAIRVFVFGESAAQGDPEPAFGFARQMEIMLESKYPQRKIEVVNLGITAVNSHVIRKIARDARDKQADYWVVYMGNNEVIGPFGAAGVLTPSTPSVLQVRTVIALKSTRLGQCLNNIAQRVQGKNAKPKRWQGMESFSARRIPADDPRRLQVEHNFQENLHAIVDSGLASGSRVLLCTVAVNQKDSAPFGSLNKPSLGADSLRQWNNLLQSGISNENSGNLPLAIAHYTQALALDDTHAETHYRLARSLRANRQIEAAQKHYRLAVDDDALQFRADSLINRAIRDTATQATAHADKVQLVDLEEILARSSSCGLLGDEYLFEHVHFNNDGNFLVAKELTSAMSVAIDNTAPSPPKTPNQKDCASALGYTTWNRMAILDQLSQRLTRPPFTFQIDHQERMKRIHESIRDLRPLVQTTSLPFYLKEVQQAVKRRPDDWMLRANQALMEENLGQKQDAVSSWNKVLQLAPLSLRALCRQGNLLGELGRTDEAQALFDRALAIRPELVEARLGKGLLHLQHEDYPAAEQQILTALDTEPDSLNALKLLAVVYQKTGRAQAAILQYRKALQLQPASPALRNNLANLLMETDRAEEALVELDAAIKDNPTNPDAQYLRSLALQRLRRPDPAP